MSFFKTNLTQKGMALGLAMLLALSGTAFAAEPDDVVNETMTSLVQRIEAEREALDADPSKINDIVNELVIPRFDFNGMSARILAKHWEAATDDQKTQFSSEFQTFLVSFYAKALLGFSGQTINVVGSKKSKDGSKAIVDTEIDLGNGDKPVPVVYLMVNNDDDWQVVDVKMDGISIVKLYRGEYDSVITKEGIDGLIAKLKERNTELAEKNNS